MKPWKWQGIAFVICMATYSVANWIGPIASVLPKRAVELLLLALGDVRGKAFCQIHLCHF
jgi:hypothetical protein